jgi:hypothetical protein
MYQVGEPVIIPTTVLVQQLAMHDLMPSTKPPSAGARDGLR